MLPPLLVLALAAPALPAQTGHGVPATLSTLEGSRPVRLTGWGPQGPEVDGRPAPRDWLELELARAPAASPPWVLGLAGGGWLPGAPGGGSGDVALWRTPHGIPVPLDLLWVRRLSRAKFRPREASERDLLWLLTGGESLDRRTGYLLGWEVAGLEFEGVGGAQRFPWERVSALQLVEEAVEEPAGGVWLLLAGGGQLACRPTGLEPGALRADLPWHKGWRAPLRGLAALRRKGRPFSDLGTRPPDFVQGPPAGFLQWEPRAGRSVEGRPLRVGGREFASGFGTRVPAEIAFDGLGPGRFVCRVGIDDEVLGFRDPSPVVFRVLLDDREIARSGIVRAGAGTEDLAADLPARGRLRLVAEAADRLPFGGHADWLDPLFLEAGALEDWP